MRLLQLVVPVDARELPESVQIYFVRPDSDDPTTEEAKAQRKQQAVNLYRILVKGCGLGTIQELSHLLISLPHPDSLPEE